MAVADSLLVSLLLFTKRFVLRRHLHCDVLIRWFCQQLFGRAAAAPAREHQLFNRARRISAERAAPAQAAQRSTALIARISKLKREVHTENHHQCAIASERCTREHIVVEKIYVNYADQIYVEPHDRAQHSHFGHEMASGRFLD